MKKSIILVIVALLLGLSSFNLLMAQISANQLDSALNQVEALANSEEGDESGCPSGGPGSTYCSHSWTTYFYDENGQVIRSEEEECDVNCNESFYACCRRGGCFCVNNNAEMP